MTAEMLSWEQGIGSNVTAQNLMHNYTPDILCSPQLDTVLTHLPALAHAGLSTQDAFSRVSFLHIVQDPTHMAPLT